MQPSKNVYFPSLEEGFIGQKRIVLPPDIQKKQASNKLIQQFYITAIGYYPNAKHHKIHRPDGATDYIFLYCATGEGTVTVSGEQYLLTPNTYFILPQHTTHEYNSSEELPWTIYWAHFNGPTAKALVKRSLGASKKQEIKPYAFNEQIFQLFDQTMSMLEHNYTTAQLEVINLIFLHFLSRFIYHEQINHNIYDSDNISSSIQFMKDNLSRALSLDELASMSGLSASHFALIFKKKMGLSPIRYFNQLKIQKSCQYLYFTRTSIKVICRELGFDDPYYFSRLFKKCMGISPYNYRKTHNPI